MAGADGPLATPPKATKKQRHARSQSSPDLSTVFSGSGCLAGLAATTMRAVAVTLPLAPPHGCRHHLRTSHPGLRRRRRGRSRGPSAG